ncbi:MAG TPA: hypothetical protein VJU78_11845, partial [Chitinophagaceae bacterium]|nr:hypothetical protein [Chitinophagaceae bacterium]
MKACISTGNFYKRNYFIYAVSVYMSMIGLYNSTLAQKNKTPLSPLTVINGKFRYTPDSSGNRIPDFSYCGYKAGEQKIPDVAIKVVVPVKEGDATWRIQSAIDFVSKLPADASGMRGTVLLQKGKYKVEGSLKLHTSGVVLRGTGFGDEGTIMIGAGKGRSTLIEVAGKDDRSISASVAITDEYVPVNANTIHVADIDQFKKGDKIIITRPSTKEWIEALGTNHFGGGITSLGWKPGQRSIEWIRTVTSVDDNTITFDVPLTTALDKKYGGGTVASFAWPGSISNCGVENLKLISEYDTGNEKDEDHRWMAITINNTTDA